MTEEIKKKLYKYLRVFLGKKGFNCIEINEDDKKIIAFHEDNLVFIDVVISDTGFKECELSRTEREEYAIKYLLNNSDMVISTKAYKENNFETVRFDELSCSIYGGDKAMLRHHINCLGGADK